MLARVRLESLTYWSDYRSMSGRTTFQVVGPSTRAEVRRNRALTFCNARTTGSHARQSVGGLHLAIELPRSGDRGYPNSRNGECKMRVACKARMEFWLPNSKKRAFQVQSGPLNPKTRAFL